MRGEDDERALSHDPGSLKGFRDRARRNRARRPGCARVPARHARGAVALLIGKIQIARYTNGAFSQTFGGKLETSCDGYLP